MLNGFTEEDINDRKENVSTVHRDHEYFRACSKAILAFYPLYSGDSISVRIAPEILSEFSGSKYTHASPRISIIGLYSEQTIGIPEAIPSNNIYLNVSQLEANMKMFTLQYSNRSSSCVLNQR